MASVPAAHRALADKIDGFDLAVRGRRASDMECKAGCSSCCRDQLTVNDVEASLLREGASLLTHAAMDRLELRVDGNVESSPCLFLEDDGRCAVYASRPMVCRTQGLPLRYAEGVIPVAAIFGRTAKGEAITWCPLNFTLRAPEARDTLDAELVDHMVSRSNHEAGGDPHRRTSLLELAREAIGGRTR